MRTKSEKSKARRKRKQERIRAQKIQEEANKKWIQENIERRKASLMKVIDLVSPQDDYNVRKEKVLQVSFRDACLFYKEKISKDLFVKLEKLFDFIEFTKPNKGCEFKESDDSYEFNHPDYLFEYTDDGYRKNDTKDFDEHIKNKLITTLINIEEIKNIDILRIINNIFEGQKYDVTIYEDVQEPDDFVDFSDYEGCNIMDAINIFKSECLKDFELCCILKSEHRGYTCLDDLEIKSIYKRPCK